MPSPAPTASLTSRALAWMRRSENSTLIALSLVVGTCAGFGAIAFRWLIERATLLFTGTADYAATTDHPSHPWLPWLGGFFVILAPAVGGLLHGPLVQRFAPEARGHGVPEVMYAIHRRGGRIPAKVAFVKALASAITIGSGGSVGREGPIVQIGSAIGSSLAQRARLNENGVRMLVACGAAGGIAATFNAPIAGVFFAFELLLASIAARSFGAIVISAVTASVIGRVFLGDEPFLVLPEFSVGHLGEYGLYVVLGLLAALVGVAFTRVLYKVEDWCDAAWKGPEWARPAAGGLLLGVLLFALPQMYGVGYPVLEGAVMGAYAIGFLVLLLVAKIVATSLTIGIGGSGGVFAPSLFLGAMLGAAFGQAAQLALPGLDIHPGAYALVGMAAMFAGAARAPITAVIILFELTGEYTIILPLMLAVAVATLTSSALSHDTIYTLKLRRRGVDITQRAGGRPLDGLTVGDLMTVAPPSVPLTLGTADAVGALVAARRHSLPVVGADGSYAGIVTSPAAAGALTSDDDVSSVTVERLLDWHEPLRPDQAVEDVLEAMLSEEAENGVAVVGPDGALVGWLHQEAVLRKVSTVAT
ncbi:chloride channel protein [Demequina sp. SYSU T00039]|uniref:Chloride channel protein n=1 Tax=Demequina lignilytica TaxID=3051663 RepID=A0AAW7M877_9MICO|nr:MULTISPECIES: chloride channel protein [unclassified Demequina]MDN4479257.1 chloride channel protein [Demequina sp. SYSU T00039-1]MDN4487575.1 chloride channel protein [Demequina sp. SYSU T00039]